MVAKIHTTTRDTASQVLMKHPQMDAIIKSARIFEKGGFISIDYRVYPEFKKDNKERTRFSTGESCTKRAMQRLNRDKYALALAHYLESNTFQDNDTLTLGDIALDAINSEKGNRQEDTHNDYLMIYEVSIKPVFEHSVLREIKVVEIKKWKDALLQSHPMSQARFKKYFRVLNAIFKFALENEMLERNPVSLVDKKSKLFTQSKKSLDNKYYTATEVEKMLTNSTKWFRVMLMVYLHTGMRTGEGLALKWSDISFEKQIIIIQRSIRKGKIKESTKTGEDRVVMMSQPLKEALLAYRDECSSEIWLFPNPKTGKPYYEANSITKHYFIPLLKKCGIENRTMYALRHTFASLSVQKNIPMSIISRQLGHAKISTTMDFYVKHNLLSNDNDSNIFDRLYA